MIELLPAPAVLPRGQRVYAIGDVHGCLDRLVALHEMIAEDLAERPSERATLDSPRRLRGPRQRQRSGRLTG